MIFLVSWWLRVSVWTQLRNLAVFMKLPFLCLLWCIISKSSPSHKRKDFVCPEISCKCGNKYGDSHITGSAKEDGNQSKRDVILEGKILTPRSSQTLWMYLLCLAQLNLGHLWELGQNTHTHDIAQCPTGMLSEIFKAKLTGLGTACVLFYWMALVTSE